MTKAPAECLDKRGCYLHVRNSGVPACEGICGLQSAKMEGNLNQTLETCASQGWPVMLKP
jgi:hypothetical protein